MLNVNIIKDQDVILILKRMLNKLDPRLVDHGERVAYLCIKLMQSMGVANEKYLHVAKLALFHDIGAYKTDEIDSLLGFESKDVWEHAIYGYLFLSRMSPLIENSDCILYHHLPYHQLLKTGCSNQNIASIIHLCDRIDVALTQGITLDILLNQEGMFDPKQVAVFKEINKDQSLIKALKDTSYKKEMNRLYQSIHLNENERQKYLEMLAYSIDFNSEFTVLHTIMTTSLAVELGKQFDLDIKEMRKLYYSALLHDIGKGAIPISILEKCGKLNEEETQLMQTHVSITEEILDGYVQEDILHMAVRHHEKLDGSGYPHHLTGFELTLGDRIVAIADILSALLGKRSYKEAFSVSKAITIIKDMANDRKIDSHIVQLFIEHHEEILLQVNQNTERIRQLYLGMQDDYVKLKRVCMEFD